jgi:precorrin-8X/cobalt-precorrin-8 methylmutase
MERDARESGGLDRPGLVKAGREIEEESFRIIDVEMGEHGLPGDQWQVVRRVIHTTGDFDFARSMKLHPLAIAAGCPALRAGCKIFTDTRMIQVGLSPWRLKWFGNAVVTPALEPESQEWAEEQGTTRSVAAFRHYSRELDGAIIAIGNAPTALFEVCRLVHEAEVRPALIVGTPVGFVQAAESKEALYQMTAQPSIVNLGRKGGSAIAVAILHALFELAKTTRE